MSAFGAAKLYFTLGVIAALIAFFAWEHVEDLVTHSPYWAQSPSAAQELGSHVAPARGPTAITIAGGEKVQVVVWLEHSHSYVRTGPFSAKTVINPALAIHALFPGNEVLRHHIRDGWDVTIDHESFDPVLTPGGMLNMTVPSIVGTLIFDPLTASSRLNGISVSRLLPLILKVSEGRITIST